MAEAEMEECDEDLLVRSSSEPEAFSVFYGRHGKSVLRYFAHWTFDPETAADLTAETFAQAFAARGRFRDRGAGGKAWLFTIAGGSRGTCGEGVSPRQATRGRVDSDE